VSLREAGPGSDSDLCSTVFLYINTLHCSAIGQGDPNWPAAAGSSIRRLCWMQRSLASRSNQVLFRYRSSAHNFVTLDMCRFSSKSRLS